MVVIVLVLSVIGFYLNLYALLICSIPRFEKYLVFDILLYFFLIVRSVYIVCEGFCCAL